MKMGESTVLHGRKLSSTWVWMVLLWSMSMSSSGSRTIVVGAQGHTDPISVYKCPDSPMRGMAEPWRIQVPSYPFELNLTLEESNQTWTGCDSDSSRMDLVSYFFDETFIPGEEPLDDETRSYFMAQNYLTPQGILAVDHGMYQRDEYCLYNYSRGSRRPYIPPQLTFKTCPFNCSINSKPGARSPCIKKCCPFGMAVDFTYGHPGCLPSSPEREAWTGKFYDKQSWKRMSPEGEKQLRPHYHHYLLQNCTMVETWFGETVTQMNTTHPKQTARLLSDGNMIFISGKRRWEMLDGVDYCIDGMQNANDGQGHDYSGQYPRSSSNLPPWPESEQVVILCASDFPPPQSPTLSALYMGFLYGAAFFHFLTALVHGLLWEKQNSNGWSMFCLTGTMSIWCILMGNAHFLGLFGGPALRNAGACVANAILAHFFFLAGFTWLTLINYSIWTTFRTLTPRNDGKKLTQLWHFLIIGFGGPLVVVLVGITLEQLYPDKESLVLIPEYGHNICFVADYAQGVYIYYILAVLFLIIFALFGATCYKLYKFSQDTAKVRESSSAGDRSMALLYAKLSVVLGITWAFEFISWALTTDGHGQSWIWSIPDIYNLVTAFFIFLIYVCKPSTIHDLEQKYPCVKPVTQAVGKVAAVAWEKITFQSEPSSNATVSSYNQNSSSGVGGGSGKKDNLHLHSMNKSNQNLAESPSKGY